MIDLHFVLWQFRPASLIRDDLRDSWANILVRYYATDPNARAADLITVGSAG
ncbi:hypothetical protein SH528x_003184 [Novipirellula sp. SH528]|uniref:hypothetical protein n=1 Tax=Novipirellula sp. SH528 TaxID=3454466 RepID=UPI003FA0931E